jgi:nucleoside-diphosphate-sugar epimerase
MRIFVAGATGALGTQLVPLLVAAGHDVAGMTRSDAKAARLRALGAEPVVCDVYDADGLAAAVTAFAPDVVIHALTDLPADQRELAARAAANSRMRREGTRNLLTAAAKAGARRLLAESIAFPAGEGDGRAAVEEHERAVLDAGGVVLRYGRFYGPGTWHEDGTAAPPAVHVAEAARRTVAALDAPSGVITVVDDAERHDERTRFGVVEPPPRAAGG